MVRIADLAPGNAVDMISFVSFYEHKNNNGNNWVKLIIKDLSGEMSVMLFDFPEAACKNIVTDLEKNKFVRIKGKVESFKGMVNVKAQSVDIVSPPEDLSPYFQTASRPYPELVATLDKLIETITDSSIQLMVANLLGSQGRFREKFTAWPAAKGIHHAYTHGLLDHTVEVCKFIRHDLKIYDKLDYDVLIASALLHDLGKIDEIQVNDNYDYTISERGKLIPHLCTSAMWVHEEMVKIPDFPEDKGNHILHLILSHHGRKEWGVPIEPKTKEAELLHNADLRSAFLNKEAPK